MTRIVFAQVIVALRALRVVPKAVINQNAIFRLLAVIWLATLPIGVTQRVSSRPPLKRAFARQIGSINPVRSAFAICNKQKHAKCSQISYSILINVDILLWSLISALASSVLQSESMLASCLPQARQRSCASNQFTLSLNRYIRPSQATAASTNTPRSDTTIERMLEGL